MILAQFPGTPEKGSHPQSFTHFPTSFPRFASRFVSCFSIISHLIQGGLVASFRFVPTLPFFIEH
jgi:hypothetical protein